MIGIVMKILPWNEKGAGVPSPFVKVYFSSGGGGVGLKFSEIVELNFKCNLTFNCNSPRSAASLRSEAIFLDGTGILKYSKSLHLSNPPTHW